MEPIRNQKLIKINKREMIECRDEVEKLTGIFCDDNVSQGTISRPAV